MFKLTQMVMALAPYGVCALMAWMTGKYGVSLLLPLLKVIGAVYLGCLLHVLGVYSSLLLLMARLNPLHYFKSIVDAQAVAFTSSSSSSTLPISLACAERRLGVSPPSPPRCCPSAPPSTWMAQPSIRSPPCSWPRPSGWICIWWTT